MRNMRVLMEARRRAIERERMVALEIQKMLLMKKGRLG